MNRKGLTISDIVQIPMFTAFLIICSWLSVRIGAVPISFSVVAVYTCAGLLGAYKATICIAVYVMLGIIGVPVFSGFLGGVAAIAGPTGGFIIGYFPMALIAGFAYRRFYSRKIILFVLMLISLVPCYTLGLLWFMLVTRSSLWLSLCTCIFPFVIFDIIKLLLSFLLIERLIKIKLFTRF